MKVGDLVKLMPHCRDSDRPALVVEVPDKSFGLHCVKIMFFDDSKKVSATKNNLEIISESR